MVSTEFIQKLAERSKKDDALKISIYIDMFPFGEEQKKNVKKFQEQLKAIENEIDKQDLEISEDLESNISKAKQLIEQDKFWKHQNESLALFISDQEMQFAKLDFGISDYNYLGNSFYIKPLFKGLDYPNPFLILDISENHNRVLICNRYEFDVADISYDNWPEGIEDLEKLKDRDQELQLHSQRSRGDYQVHGQNKWQDKQNADKKEYFRLIEDGLRDMLDGEIHLILASTKDNYYMYKKQARHTKVKEFFLEGDYSNNNPQELWQEAKGLINKNVLVRQQKKVEQLVGEEPKHKKITQDFEQVVKASKENKIETIYMELNEKKFSNSAEKSEKVDNEELMNKLVISTINSSGHVEIVPENTFKEDVKVLATLRY